MMADTHAIPDGFALVDTERKWLTADAEAAYRTLDDLAARAKAVAAEVFDRAHPKITRSESARLARARQDAIATASAEIERTRQMLLENYTEVIATYRRCPVESGE